MISAETPRRFAPIRFLVINALLLTFIFTMISILLPNTWALQFSASWQLLAITFIGVHFFNAFFEYFVHRYVLHLPVVPFLKKFHFEHTLHHSLTDIKKQGELVSNEYAIVQKHQHEASFMPWFTFLMFSLFYLPLFILISYINPEIPIFLAGYSAAFFSLVFYELFHAMLHWPIETWKRLFAQKYIGLIWRNMYKHHMRHHADIRYNESISGFFGLPVSDWFFGTYISAKTLYPHRGTVPESEFAKPKPGFFIAWLDKILYRYAQKNM